MLAAALLIADQDILNAYLRGSWPEIEDVRQSAERALRQQEPFQPDYARRARLRETGVLDLNSGAYSGYAELLLSIFRSLSSGLWLRGRVVHVSEKGFENWQNTLTLTPPLPVLSYFAATHWPGRVEAKQVFAEWFASTSCLPGPYLPMLHELAQCGLSEHHMHINGTTESDYVWQDVLARPKALMASISKGAAKRQARQQLAQVNNGLDFNDLYRLLKLGSKLRAFLAALATGKSAGVSMGNLQAMVTTWPGMHESRHPFKETSTDNNGLVNEAMLWHTTFLHLSSTGCQVTARGLHIYLLIQSLFHRLLSQQLIDKGFDQFERITQNELREPTEKRYEQRFNQLQGMYKVRFKILEARFAPKDDVGDLNNLLHAIKAGYEKSALAPLSTLQLTAHFIKQKDTPKPTHPCRHYPLRKRLERQRKVLVNYLAARPDMASLINRIDAAGNEMNAGPEVFAPTYRKMRASGWKHFTYHAGEDFQHLLGGMRQIYETIHFLGMQTGDRIGHATAIGIEPELWVSRAAPSQQMHKGEWLDTFLFTHHQLLRLGTEDAIASAYRLELKIQKLAEEIFGATGISTSALQTMWLNRWRDPLAEDYSQKPGGISGELLSAWHKPEIYRRAREYAAESTELLSNDLYRELQNQLLAEITSRRLAIETLPTSNVRISYYKSYSEHHVYRWLSAEPRFRPEVVFGTDDPGIFSTNLYNELAHIEVQKTHARQLQFSNNH